MCDSADSHVNPFVSLATYSFTCVTFVPQWAHSPQQGSYNNAALLDCDSIQIIQTKLLSLGQEHEQDVR